MKTRLATKTRKPRGCHSERTRGICFALFFALGLCLSLAIPLRAQEDMPDLSRSTVDRIRIEGFSWQLDSQKLRWAVTTGKSDEEGNYVVLGPARNCELSLEEATLSCSDAAQKFSPPFVHHLSEDIGSILQHLFEMSAPWAVEEPEPETPQGAAQNWIAEALWD